MKLLKHIIRTILLLIAVGLVCTSGWLAVYTVVSYIDGSITFYLPRALFMTLSVMMGIAGAYGFYSAAKDMRRW